MTRTRRAGLMVLLVALAAPAAAQSGVDEHQDWGVAPQSALRLDQLRAPTPADIPAAEPIDTVRLRGMLEAPGKPLLVNVLGGEAPRGIPGSLWLSGGGRGIGFDDLTQKRLAQHLARATHGNKAAAVVFYGLDAQCWLAYNASLRAVRLGYTRVLWYRGGIAAWDAAGLPVVTLTDDTW
jgi:PQQ-dependent catabolism-associated CXXCW motif protein